MTMYLVAAILSVAVAGFIFFSRLPSSSTPSEELLQRIQERFINPAEAERITNRLEQLHYFRFALPSDIERLKADVADSLSRYGVLSTIESSLTGLPLDLRYYELDGETLFERGGFREKLDQMQPLFKQLGLRLEVTEYTEQRSGSGLDLSFRLNGKKYVAFHRYTGKCGWSTAASRFAEIVNDQLSLQQSHERLFLINSGNDGAAVFLSPDQFGLVDAVLKDQLWKPLRLKEWQRFNTVDRMEQVSVTQDVLR